MVTENYFILLLGNFYATLSLSLEENLDSDNAKFVDDSYIFIPKLWTNHSRLLAVEKGDPLCRKNADKIFSNLDAKNLYYRCNNGKKELYLCFDGFEFNTKFSRCMPKDSMDISTWNETTTRNECSYQMDGFYPDYNSTCQEYYRCENGVKVEVLKCSPTKLFAFHHQQCQPRKEVVCVNSNCHRDNHDFYIFPGSKCQAYYLCQSGTRLDFICPKGTTFDLRGRACVENRICYEPVCAGRIDGTYADTTHNCIRSFTCKGGLLEEVNSCPSGQKHDGLSCVSSEHHYCEKPEKTAAAFHFRTGDECKTLADGSHVVPGTDCRNVRVCLRGKTSAEFECYNDERYDGTRCLPKNMVPCDDFCAMKSNGYHADEATLCREYYYCLNEKVLIRNQCSNGTAFNGVNCIPENLVFCPKNSGFYTNICLGLRDGFHPDYLNNCQNFFYCYNHEMVLLDSCMEGLLYDGKQCVRKGSIICESSQELNECIGRPQGLYQNKSSGCNSYLYCSRNGIGTKLSCPLGLLFNGYKCVSEDEYTCSNSDVCHEQPDGYKQDENTGCRSYYFCSKGNKITYICPNQMVFNGTQCVPRETYDCPYVSSRDCINKTNGYHADKASDCRDYYYCSKGEKLNTLTCGGRKIFDGKGCILVEDSLNVCFGSLGEPCLIRPDGIYADFRTDCRRYFVCTNNSVASEKWCPKGFRFNGSICSNNFVCHNRNDCVGKHVGFYQDLPSGCRSYYFCFFNSKTIGICPIGTLFNGHLCIDSHYYTCPRMKAEIEVVNRLTVDQQ